AQPHGVRLIHRRFHVQWPQGQLAGRGRRLLAVQNSLLLAAVAAWVTGEDHRVATAGQQASPTLEAFRIIPEAVGDQHQMAIGGGQGFHHHQLQGLLAMGNRDLQGAHADRAGADDRRRRR
ncbi:MAG: hypothetical protein ACK56I_20740, partial [bacterium]